MKELSHDVLSIENVKKGKKVWKIMGKNPLNMLLILCKSTYTCKQSLCSRLFCARGVGQDEAGRTGLECSSCQRAERGEHKVKDTARCGAEEEVPQ